MDISPVSVGLQLGGITPDYGENLVCESIFCYIHCKVREYYAQMCIVEYSTSTHSPARDHNKLIISQK